MAQNAKTRAWRDGSVVRAHTARAEDPGSGPGPTTTCGPLQGELMYLASVSTLIHMHTLTDTHTHSSKYK